MRLLFAHQNFPGQYKHLAPRLAANAAHEVLAIGEQGALARIKGREGAMRCFGYPPLVPASGCAHRLIATSGSD